MPAVIVAVIILLLVAVWFAQQGAIWAHLLLIVLPVAGLVYWVVTTPPEDRAKAIASVDEEFKNSKFGKVSQFITQVLIVFLVIVAAWGLVKSFNAVH